MTTWDRRTSAAANLPMDDRQVRHDAGAAIYNIYTGLGLTDSASGARVRQLPRLSDEEIHGLFSSTWLGYSICTRPVRDALQRWPHLSLDNEDSDPKVRETAALVMDRVERLGREAVANAATFARAFGGAVIYVGAKDGRTPDQPLNIATLSEVTHFTVFQASELDVVQVQDDPLAPGYGEPTHYRLRQQIATPQYVVAPKGVRARGPVIIHASRMVWFRGAITARERFEHGLYWDDSILQRAHDVVTRIGLSWQSASNLLSKANLLALKQKGYRNMISSSTDSLSTLNKQMQLLRVGMSAAGVLHMDADDEFVNVTMSFAGVPNLLDRLSVEISAATGIPVTVLWGTSPGGQNATGDSDWKNYERLISSIWTWDLKKPLTRLCELVMLAKDSPVRGVLPQSWWIDFPPVTPPTEIEESKLRKLDAETFALLIANDIATPSEVAMSVFGEQGYSRNIKIDLDARQGLIELENDRMAELAAGEGDEADGDETSAAADAEGDAEEGAEVDADAEPESPPPPKRRLPVTT